MCNTTELYQNVAALPVMPNAVSCHSISSAQAVEQAATATEEKSKSREIIMVRHQGENVPPAAANHREPQSVQSPSSGRDRENRSSQVFDFDRWMNHMLNVETLAVAVFMLIALAFASNGTSSSRGGGYQRPLQPLQYNGVSPDGEFQGTSTSQIAAFNRTTHALADQVTELRKELEVAETRSRMLEEREEAVERKLEEQLQLKQRTAMDAHNDVEAYEAELRAKLEEQKLETRRAKEELIERTRTEMMEGGNTAPQESRSSSTRGAAASAAVREADEAVRNHLADLARDMADAVGRLSREEVIRRFGEEPRRVRFDLRFPVDAADASYAEAVDASYPPGDEFASFTVEMAPLHLVPHSIHTFLSQVESKLWDGCLFRQSPRWGLLGEPWNPTERMGREQKFRDAKLHHLSFPEYSPEFPHARFTLAYYGGSGGGDVKGPNLYVNSRDNFDLWRDDDDGGDGGESEIDPCFARIVEGEDVMMRAWSGKHRGEDSNILRDPVTIVKASILDL